MEAMATGADLTSSLPAPLSASGFSPEAQVASSLDLFFLGGDLASLEELPPEDSWTTGQGGQFMNSSQSQGREHLILYYINKFCVRFIFHWANINIKTLYES